MKVLIVEDEIMAQKSLIRTITQNFPDMEIAGTSGSVKNTVEWLKTPGNHADIIFMDVELSDGECFEIFRQHDIKSKVIMTTAYDSYAIKAFEAGSIDYLLKPIDLSALKRAVARCRTNENSIDIRSLLQAMEGGHTVQKEYKERYIIRFNDRIIPVNTDKVAYVYSEEKTNWLITFDGEKYIIDSSLDVMIEELDSDKFFRISRSCIISINAIKSIIKQSGSRLKIISTPDAPFEMTVSRSRVDDFLEWLER
ncbi:MAG: response regulator transcription factor [Bacteroidales bacterium]|nr:response regulator transcription factor [Bacteroidales bacterium]